MKRYEIEHAVLRARLPGPEVTVMLVLCSRINARTSVIPRQHQPSTRALARLTGYSRDTVKRHLRVLESAGWIEITRPPQWLAASHHVTNEYTLLVPENYPQAGPAGNPDLGRLPAAAGPAGNPDLGRPPAAAGPAPGHKTDSHRQDLQEPIDKDITSDEDPQLRTRLAGVVQAEIAELTGRKLTSGQAAEVARLVLAGRKVKHHEAYLRRALRADPQRYVPAASQPPPFSDLARIQREAIEQTGRKETQQ